MEIDPRLRDASGNAFSHHQHPTSNTISTLNAASDARARQPPPHHQTTQDGSPHHQSPYPTPRSGGNFAEQDGTQDGGPNDLKRLRACEACRGLKVRCEPDLGNPDGPCKRCAKANRNCVVTVPSRKRQKKTDSRVAELEKKINALTASLHASKPIPGSGAQSSEDNGLENEGMTAQARQNTYQQVTNGGYGSPYLARPEHRGTEWASYTNASGVERKASAPPMVVAGQKRKHSEGHQSAIKSESPTQAAALLQKYFEGNRGAQAASLMVADSKPPQTHEYADVIDRGIISADDADRVYKCYVEKMAPHMPAVVFPSGTNSGDVRKTKPTLFLAILSAASGMIVPNLQRMLTKEVMSAYAERIIINGEKALELIQALHISTIWYWAPEHFEELKFYQLIHIAAVMALDIGMGKKLKPGKSKTVSIWKDHPWRRTPYPDPESLEARRTWVTCYFLCCNASMGLRRPNLIRWSPFMAECVEVLETSPDAYPGDKTLCQWVRSQHISEEIGTQFSMDDPCANVSIADQKVQFALKGFERDLEKWSSQIPPEVQSPTLKMTEHVVNLYMHEVAMHVDHNVDEFKPPFTEETLRGAGEAEKLTPAHISALSTCLTSIDGILETFQGLDIETIRCLPVSNFVRVAYAVVILIKMYFSASTPNSELGKVIDKDNMKVEQYLDRLLEVFKAAAAEDKSRPSSKFLVVLIMLKTWMHRQREGKSSLPMTANESSAGASATAPLETSTHTPRDSNQSQNQSKNQGGQRNEQPQGYSSSNTPLQLLSEVATGNSRGQSRSESAGQYPGAMDWQQPQQQQPFQNYGSMNQMPMQQQFMGGNIDPALSMDLGYTMGDNLEQAMEMTLGFGDYGPYFGEDTFFTGLIDSVGGAPGFEGF